MSHPYGMVVVMKRTVRLATLPLNEGKRASVRELAAAYAQAKDRFLRSLAPTAMWHYLGDKRGFRDWAKSKGLYPSGMSVHLADQAAFDAADTWVRHIEAQLATSEIKAKIWRRFEGESRHYAYSVLKSYRDIGLVLRGGVPDREKIRVTRAEREAVCWFLHRHLRAAFDAARNPRVHLARSFSLDETLYSTWVEERGGGRHQYVSIVGPKAQHRIVLPLAGVSKVEGNVRIVLEEGDDRAFVHVAYSIAQMKEGSGPRKSIDWGVTEVATDQQGHRYGIGYGTALEKISESNKLKGQRRGKLGALTKKDAGSKRARHIARHNLGTKKQKARLRRSRAQLRTIAGAAIKEIVYGSGNRTRARGRVTQAPSQRPRLIIHEDLSHLRGKAKSKKLSRLCSTWMRAETEGRMVVHAYRGCSPTKAVNAAYTSQTCPEPSCGYVHADNRSGDRFHCRNPYWDCNWQGGADQVAAMNIMSRDGDREIALYTKHTEVKRILDERFRHRLESRTGGTGVPTNGTASDGDPACAVEGEATAHGRTPSRPRRPRSDVGGAISDTDSQSPVHTERTGETQRLESEKKRSA